MTGRRQTLRISGSSAAGVAAVIAAAYLAGCSGMLGLQDDIPRGADSGADSGADGGTTGSPDAASSASRDATTAVDGEGPSVDASLVDVVAEAASDGSSDAATDASPIVVGTPIALIAADAGMQPMRLAQDDTYVYFSEANTGGVYRIAKTGGTPIAFWQGNTFPYAVAVDDTTLYWGDVEGIWRCPKAGCPGGIETPIAPSIDNVQSIAIDQTHVYWTDDEALEVQSAPLSGADAGTELWLGTGTNSPLRIAVDGAHVFFTAEDGRLHIVRIDGGAVSPSTLGAADAATLGVTVQGAQVFWTARGPHGAVLETSATAPTAASVVAPDQGQPGAVASDGVNLYWLGTDADGGTLSTCTIANCQATKLVGSLVGPNDVIVDSNAVYFSDEHEQSGVLWKLPR